MLTHSQFLQLAEGDTILSCANKLHVGAKAYGLLMPSLAPGNNIIERGSKKRKVEIREGLERRMKRREQEETRKSVRGERYGCWKEREREEEDGGRKRYR